LGAAGGLGGVGCGHKRAWKSKAPPRVRKALMILV
jgi:hypothetical protein